MLKQISVVLKNVPGQLADLSVLLGKEGVNIRAISVADTSEVSTVRIVVDEPAKAAGVDAQLASLAAVVLDLDPRHDDLPHTSLNTGPVVRNAGELQRLAAGESALALNDKPPRKD